MRNIFNSKVRAQRALVDAIKAGDRKKAENALKCGADVNAVDGGRGGLSVLQMAVVHGASAEMVEWLAARVDDINYQDRDGQTALHAAIYRGDGVAIPALIRHGINTALKSKRGLTAEELMNDIYGPALDHHARQSCMEGFRKGMEEALLRRTRVLAQIARQGKRQRGVLK